MASKRIVKFISFVLCIALIFLWPEASVYAEGAVWEETYYSTPTSYYTGPASTKSIIDSSFGDWSGVNLVRVDAKEHPENFFKQPASDLSYRYAFAWDKTNLYIYLQIDKEITSLTEFAPCLYFDLTPALYSTLGVVKINYDSAAKKMAVWSAKYKTSDITASIKVFGKQIGSVTHIEASIPWAATMETTFTPDIGSNISFCMGVNTQAGTSILYAHETTTWGSTYPNSSSRNYIPLYLTSGTPAYNVKTPEPLTESALLSVPSIDINDALGRPYTGTAITLSGWTQSAGRGYLTEGSFESPSTLTSDYTEAFAYSDRESDGSIVRTVDLGQVQSGLYRFSVGAAQITQQGIVFPDSIMVYASQNGYHYQYLGTCGGLDTSDYQSIETEGALKETKKYNLLLGQGFSARYIKYKIIPSTSNGGNVVTCLTELASYYQIESAQLPKKDAIISLGAKVNASLKGIRFGAQYNKDADKTVKQLGVLIYPSDKLGLNTLDLGYYNSNPYNESNQSGVLLVNAVMISKSDFVAGKTFDEYETFVFFATITSIPDTALSKKITAVPFVEYTDGSIFYGAAIERSYSGVLAVSEAIDE